MRHDIRLFAPAILSWVAAAILVQTESVGYRVAAVSAATVLTIWFLWAWRLRKSDKHIVDTSVLETLLVTLSLTLVLTTVIAARVGFEHQVRHSPGLQAVVEDAREVRLSAVATSTPIPVQKMSHASSGVALQLNATLTSVRVGEGNLRTSVPVRLFLNEKPTSAVEIGSELSITGKISALPEGRATPYMVNVSEVDALPPPAFLRFTNALRERLRHTATEFDGWGAQLIPGLAVGDTQLVDAELDSAMKAASLSHLTAVSGANCAIIVGIVLVAGAAFRLRRVLRVTLAALFLAAFVTLVTPEPSVLRAGVMSIVALLGMLSARKGAGIAALGVAILVLLVLDPWQATHLGFVLSVLATGGILLFTEPIRRRLERFMPNWLALTFAVPIAAQFACQPAIILIQPTLPTFGVLANILAAPAAPISTITGLVACLALPVWPWFGEFCTWLTWWPASWIASIARISSTLPAAQLPWIDGWFGALLLAVIGVTMLFAFSRAAGVMKEKRAGGWQWVLGALAISILLAIAVVRPIAMVSSIPPNWRIFACDVGQGDGVLVRGDAGIALIDTGFDADKISSCLDVLGIRQIDLLVLTHDDNDHVGGLSGVIGRVRTAVVAPATLASPKNRPILDALADQKIHTVIAHRGTHGSLGDTSWQVIWPTEGRIPASPNDSSVTVRIETPELSALFLGDLGEQAQRDLMRVEQVQPVDVVKVSHHGSSDQFAGLYQAIHAQYGVISVGADNGYGHPTSKLLKTLAGSGTTALRTDLSGALAIARDSDGKWVLWSGTPLG